VPHPSPEEWREATKPLLAAAQFRSWRALERGAKACWVTQKPDGSFEFSILAKGGPGGEKSGFHELGAGRQRLAATASAEKVGSALMMVLESCE